MHIPLQAYSFMIQLHYTVETNDMVELLLVAVRCCDRTQQHWKYPIL
jgi:hypothetical protein